MKGKLVSRCRLCMNWDKLKSPGSHHGLVAVEKVFPLYNEAVNRIGVYELARRAGVSRGHIEHVIFGETKHVHKRPVRAVLLELTSLKRKGEISPSKSLRWRNAQRNNSGLEVCSGCGTPKSNVTAGCTNCNDRFYQRYRRGTISEEEWLRIKHRYFSQTDENLHMGVKIK